MHKGLVDAKAQYDDMQNKEKRRNNIILYRAQESNAASAEDRNTEDTKFCLGLFHAIKSGVDREDILKVIRLGKKGDDAFPTSLTRVGSINQPVAKKIDHGIFIRAKAR